MTRQHVKKNEEVVVIAGTERGKRGKVLEVLPGSQRVIIEGIKMIKRHTKRSQQHPEGRIVEREGTIHISNVMKAEAYDARRAKRGHAAPANA